jgi:hypothetical protein
MAIKLQPDPVDHITAAERRAMRARHKALYEQFDRFVNRTERLGIDFQVCKMGPEAGADDGSMVMLVSNEELAEIGYAQLNALYFGADHVPAIARVGAHRHLDAIMTGMAEQESNIAAASFDINDGEETWQIVVTKDQPYTDSVQRYVERLIFIENNKEQLIPALQPKNTPKVWEN